MFKWRTNDFSVFIVVDKKEEIKEIKADKKKKSDSGTDDPPAKKSKPSEEGKDCHSYYLISKI